VNDRKKLFTGFIWFFVNNWGLQVKIMSFLINHSAVIWKSFWKRSFIWKEAKRTCGPIWRKGKI